jgi:hypothetical protein
MNLKQTGKHGEIRGLDAVSSSNISDGLFGRMFRTLPPANQLKADLDALAELMVDPSTAPQTPETDNPPDDEENTGSKDDRGISSGYTYLGQFLDHDITLVRTVCKNRMIEDTRRFPRHVYLDSVYGRGRTTFMYDFRDGTIKMLLGKN